MRTGCSLCNGNPVVCTRSLFCPQRSKKEALFRVRDIMNKEHFSSDAPAPFIGRFGYPYLNVGVLSPPEQTPEPWIYDAPRAWSGSQYTVPQIISLRSSLLNSRFKAQVRQTTRLLDVARQVGMASKPVPIEVQLVEKPSFHIQTSPYTAPLGPNARLKKIDITSNPAIHTKVDKVVSDTDWKAADAINYLFKSSFDENFLAKLLSVGAVGVQASRKLVPTRWSITATDDMIGRQLIAEVKEFPAISEYAAFFGGYLGNYYLILLFPEVWSYELFETVAYNPTHSSTDYEPYGGRKEYASGTVGGYYTVRLAILEKLRSMKRQAAALALRSITREYTTPLGVWVTREAARKALSSPPLCFADKESLLSYARSCTKTRFQYAAEMQLGRSRLLKAMQQQKLGSYLKQD
ncbi:MAG TPA: hypothetical protein VJC16_05015 [Candidatus Nanoarchaeia archaeon]|nr:hypothetical protein [Candidatus Nanoarchaeia archaeon]